MLTLFIHRVAVYNGARTQVVEASLSCHGGLSEEVARRYAGSRNCRSNELIAD